MTPSRPTLTGVADAAVPTVRLARRLARLEEGARENAVLAIPLETQVARLEQSLVPLLEAQESRSGRG